MAERSAGSPGILLAFKVVKLSETYTMSGINNSKKRQIDRRKKRSLQGKYANYFKVGHNAYEFVIDFGQYYPETEEAELFTRIVTSPAYAKSLLQTLQDAITFYEGVHGKCE